MLRWCTKLRSAAAKPPQISHSISSTRRIFHSAPSLHQPLHLSPNHLSSRSLFNAHSSLAAYQCIRSPLLPLSVVQVRHVSSRERAKRRKPMTPATSKLKKTKMKFYSSYKSRFWVMKDGSIKRRKEGKRHNAHLKVTTIGCAFLPAMFKASYSYVKYKGQFLNIAGEEARNAPPMSKKSKRRLRQPGTVPLAYAKVMKKLNFCG